MSVFEYPDESLPADVARDFLNGNLSDAAARLREAAPIDAAHAAAVIAAGGDVLARDFLRFVARLAGDARHG